jgi:hypothetical protein
MIFTEDVLTPQQRLTLGWLRRGSGHIESALLILLRAGQQSHYDPQDDRQDLKSWLYQIRTPLLFK